MRTTIRIDDDLLLSLKEQARQEKSPLNRVVNRMLRRGLEAARGRGTRSARYREKAHAMGEPQFNLDRALALSAALDDEQVLAKLAERK
jgi:hypothetical protein